MNNYKISNSILKIYLIVFLFTLLSGVFRKWIITDKNISNFLFLVQLLIPYSFLFLLQKGKILSPFNSFFSIFSIVLIAMAVNPLNQTIYHGILGIILHLAFFNLLFFYFRNRTLFQLNSIIRLIIYAGIFEFVLGLIQYGLPKEHFLNKYANTESIGDIASVQGTNVRVTGTFSYITGYSSFFIFYALALWTALKKKVISLRLFFGLNFMGLISCFMNASRSGVYVYLIFTVLAFYNEIQFRRLVRVSLIILITGGLLLGGMLVFNINNKVTSSIILAIKNFNERRSGTINSGEEKRRILGNITEVIDYKSDYPIFGVGLGASYQGANILWGTSSYFKNFKGFLEEEPERIIFEGGYLLLILRLILFIQLYYMLSLPWHTKLLIVLLISIFVSTIYFTYTAIFLAFGLMLIDKAYFDERNKTENILN